MKRLAHGHGYTIVEVMIFLVITGVLLASGLLVFSGRQQRTQFTQGVREVDAQIRTIINETASGYYPNSGNIKCISSNGGGPKLSASPENQQGGNEGCIFLGRVLHFNNSDTYGVYTVVGQQKGQNQLEVGSIGTGPNQAKPTLILQSYWQPDSPNELVTHKLPWGIRVTKIATPVADLPAVGAFGFISSLGAYSGVGTDLVSGKSGINLVPLRGTTLVSTPTPVSSTPHQVVEATQNMANSPQNPGKMTICLSSGGGDRKAAIFIGGSNNNTGTEVVIDSAPAECQ